VFHIINHATFKASLFMTAGIIDHETGTRDMRQLSGLMKFMPWTATLAMVAAAAMAGVPLFNGFLSKEMFFAEALDAVDASWGIVVPVVATLAGACSVAYSLRFIHDVFFNGDGQHLPKPDPHEPPLFMKLPVALLVALCVVVGVLPALTVGPLVQVAASAVLGMPAPVVKLALWHGFNLPLLMSALAVAGGAVFYWALAHDYRLHLHHPRGVTGRLLFTRAIDGLFGSAGRWVARVENGSLQRYVALMLGAAIVIGAWPLLGAGVGSGSRALTPASPLALALWALLLASGAALLRWHRERFTAVVLTGVVGLVTALAFAGLSAPDLALTQLTVEVISAVLLMMGLALLPAITPVESSALRRARDALLALAGGAAIAWIAWLVMTREHDSISWFFLANSLPEGGGANVVNVILVDFRGYDTLGEITVLAIAGIGVLALLDGLRLRRPAADAQGRRWSFARQPLLLRTLARLVLPLALVVSVHLFWRGHNLPGGGFVAGLVTAAALVLQYMALGQERADGALHGAGGRRFTLWIGVGLLIATLTGVGSFAVDAPFLTSTFGHPVVPLLGELALASAALFDLGVYITVVGATLLTLSVLGSVSKGTEA
jgi:multicomponent K+:H+ antiporter subunit A